MRRRKSNRQRFKHNPPAATVTHRPEENVFNVVNFDEGYLLKEGSAASVDVDGTTFDLFTKGDGAWSRTSDLDKAIVEAMAKGKQAIFKSMLAKGTADNPDLFSRRLCSDSGLDRQGLRRQALVIWRCASDCHICG